MALQLPRKENKRQQDVDPTESLTKALTSFKQVLTTEQLKQFENSTTVPDAGSVLFFVAQLDALNASKTRRSIAPRLCTFLTATQQFAGAVETFVSSHPETAALIWGGIKTAITVASNVASYFDKVTNMIKDIGLTCPTIQEFGQLYHGHVGLQRSLCDYYAVIIELCSKVIEVSRRPSAIHIFISIWNPFESEFKPWLEQLASSKDQVMLQISLASEMAAHEAKMLLEYESKENSSHRAFTLKFFKYSAHHQEEARQWQINQTKREKAALKIKIQQNLSPVDHIPPWKRVLKQRVQSTAEWLLHDDAFLKWKASPESSILWCSGTMGMGKTLLMSNVVSFLHSARRENDSVAHFFCQADNQPSLSARNIVGSICRQLLDSLIEGSSHEDLLSIEHDCEGLDTNETVQFLLSKMAKERAYYIVLDGVDECDTAQIREMARALEMLSQGKVGMLKIICAGRPGLEMDLFKWGRPQYRVLIDQGKLNLDMDRYIAATLYDCLEEGELVLQDEEIITTIVETLRQGSQGMFLWAGLCIRDLCEKNCDEDILEALKCLPRGLAELFDSKLHRIQHGKDSHHAMNLLQYCGVVKRPLTIEEYREALSISLGDKSLNTKRLPNDMNRIVRGCFGLTFIDDEEHTVHYTHHSVKEHLFHTENKGPPAFDAKRVNKHFGFLCMTYLNFTNFGRQLVKVGKKLVDPLFLGASSIYPDNSHKNRMLWKLQSSWKRRSPRIDVREIERTARESLGGPEHHEFCPKYAMQIGAFLVYVKDHWFVHLNDLSPDDQEVWDLFCKCIEDKSLPFSRPWDLVAQSSPRGGYGHPATEKFVKDLSAFFRCGEQELVWALKHEHRALLLSLTRTGDRTTSQEEFLSLPALNDRSSHRWLEILIDVPTFTKAWGGLLFSVALDEGLPEAEKLQVSLALLRKMHRVDALETRFALGVALRRALWANQMLGFMLSVDKAFYTDATVINDTLDDSKADAYFNSISAEQRAPLLIISILNRSFWIVSNGRRSRATARDKLQTVKDLVASGADVHLKDMNGETALHKAARVELEEPYLIKCLIDAGSEVNLANDNGQTALHIAALTDKEKNAGLLVSTNAPLNVTPNEAAASQRVSRRGFPRKRGVSKKRVSISAFLAAAKENSSLGFEVDDNLNIMRYLISAGADITLTDRRGETALHRAISMHSNASGLDEIATLAIEITNSKGIPSLSNLGEYLVNLAESGHWSTVELLIKSGVDVNIRGQALEKRALHWASERNQKEIVKLLIEHGSDPNTLDAFGQTALHYAAERGFEEITAYLLKVTDASIVDTKKRTALRCARDNGHAPTVKMLLPFAGPSDEDVDSTGKTLEEWRRLVLGAVLDS